MGFGGRGMSSSLNNISAIAGFRQLSRGDPFKMEASRGNTQYHAEAIFSHSYPLIDASNNIQLNSNGGIKQ